jgi:hypothetical protein
MTTMDTLKQFNAARRVSVPLIIWKTPDAAATINAVRGSATYPILSWDVVRGLIACNEVGKGHAEADCGVGNPVDMLIAAQKLPADSLVFMHNAHMFITDSGVKQAVWNLRDTNKGEHRTLVMLAPQMTTPVELSNDVLVIDEQLPGESELQAIVESQAGQAEIGAKDSGVKFNKLGTADITKAVDALSGLSAFAAEQTVAVSFEKNGKGVGLNLATCWDRKRQAIEETRGLKVWRDGDTLNDVQGCDNIKDFAHKVIGGRLPPRVIVWIDEMEKSGVGNPGDLSGTNQDQTGVLLTQMQETNAQGMLYVGHPGSAKSMVAKAMGATAGIPTIQLDLGAMKDSLVGNSEANIRAAMKVINAVSQGRALYIATCNKIDVLPPEIKRRFTLGTFFFDLPVAKERAAIWKYYLTKFDLKESHCVDDEGWTGADIMNCCNRAWMFRCTIAEAAKYATPVCKTNPQGIEALRRLADNAFISANYEGLYQINKQTVALTPTKGRKMSFK